MKRRLYFAALLILPAHAAEAIQDCCLPGGCGTLLSVSRKEEPPQSTAPNVIDLLADDLGGNDVGWRMPAIKTPHLDRLRQAAAAGTRRCIR